MFSVEKRGFPIGASFPDFKPTEKAQNKPGVVYYKENQGDGTFIVISKKDYDRVMKSGGTNEYKFVKVLSVKRFIELMTKKTTIERASGRDDAQRAYDDDGYAKVHQQLGLVIINEEESVQKPLRKKKKTTR